MPRAARPRATTKRNTSPAKTMTATSDPRLERVRNSFAIIRQRGLSSEAIRKELAERNLHDFFKQAWPHFDPAPFTDNWHLRVVCEHLQAVSEGEFTNLIINVPPRTAKSAMTSIVWPAWVWLKKPNLDYPLLGAGVKWMFSSYAQTLSDTLALQNRRLIGSDWFQRNWGDRFQIRSDQDSRSKFDTNQGGYRLSTS